MLWFNEDFINPGMCHVMHNRGVQMDGAQCSPAQGSEGVRSGQGLWQLPELSWDPAGGGSEGQSHQQNWFGGRGLLFKTQTILWFHEKGTEGMKSFGKLEFPGQIIRTNIVFPLEVDRLCKNFWETTQLKDPCPADKQTLPRG